MNRYFAIYKIGKNGKFNFLLVMAQTTETVIHEMQEFLLSDFDNSEIWIFKVNDDEKSLPHIIKTNNYELVEKLKYGKFATYVVYNNGISDLILSLYNDTENEVQSHIDNANNMTADEIKQCNIEFKKVF